MNFLDYVGLWQIHITKKNSTELYKNLCKISSRTGYTQAQRGSEVGGQRQAPAALSPKMTQ